MTFGADNIPVYSLPEVNIRDAKPTPKTHYTWADYNPFQSTEIYFSAQVKSTQEGSTANKFVGYKLPAGINDFKVVEPLIGITLSGSTSKGFNFTEAKLDQMYINYKVNKNADLRVYPMQGYSQGDWTPGVRGLYTFLYLPTEIILFDVPVIVGGTKFQVDVSWQNGKVRDGGRVVWESVPLHGFTLEISVGGRFNLVLPRAFR